ncbi:glycosyltransferase [Azospirillum sp. RWY-5-1]|uniref:Glycosyltransferase n=1 Tax=Azospirillum oleiclasticum TaxID=2735135 RepID=A0ABX2TLU2_9PROT|nr:glycosyltransferase [Azospirillum oleiclasticum]NYZ17767.1 glycosyltransferase [Azospirillum oleiclasticum]NYZ24187.1 glycosyltransferase [Azospirillum oleiclasticum]
MTAPPAPDGAPLVSPLVSVVIPVYNGANYLGEAIDSVLAQTYADTEIIVVDDGSTDGGATAAVAARYGDAIRYLHKPNGGVATALNLGIRSMRGTLFSWLSHDDVYKPEKLAVQVEAFRRFGRDCVVVGDFETIDADGRPLALMSAGASNLLARPLDGVFYGLLNGCALLIPRALFDRAGLFEPGLPTTQDYHLWYRMARLVPFVHSPQALVRQRTHPLQGSRHMRHLEEADRMFAHLVDETPPALMRAYDGSELAFLTPLRRNWRPVYRGASAHVGHRIGWLLDRLPVAVVPLGDGPGSAGRPSWADGLPPAWTVLADPCPGGTAEDTIRAVLASSPANVLAFIPDAHPNPRGLLRTALEDLFLYDRELVRPRPVDGAAPGDDRRSVLDGLLLRRAAGGAVLAACTGNRLDATGLRMAPYDPSVALAVQTTGKPDPASGSTLGPADGDPLDRALGGAAVLDYRDGLRDAVLARLARHRRPGLPTILFLCHRHGGGTWTHLRDLTAALAGRANALIAHGGPDRRLMLCLPSAGTMDGEGRGLAFRMPGQTGAFAALMRAAGVARVDAVHTMGYEDDALAALGALALPYDVTLVDYHTLAAEPHLCGNDGRFVGMERLRDRDPWIVRSRPLPVLAGADRVIAISRHVAATAGLLCPGLPLVCAAHWARPAPERRHVFRSRLWEGEPLRVLLIGRINTKKGSAVVAEAARILHRRNLPVRLHVLGDIHPLPDEAREAERAGFLVRHGRYADGGLSEAVGGIAPHLAWLPAQAPETWSYVLSEIMELCLPLAAGAIGAIPERCRDRPATWLLPWDSPADAWVELFLRLHATGLRAPPCTPPAEEMPPDDLPEARPFYFDEYLLPLDRHEV